MASLVEGRVAELQLGEKFVSKESVWDKRHRDGPPDERRGACWEQYPLQALRSTLETQLQGVRAGTQKRFRGRQHRWRRSTSGLV